MGVGRGIRGSCHVRGSCHGVVVVPIHCDVSRMSPFTKTASGAWGGGGGKGLDRGWVRGVCVV
jgi:hypothetical protein